MIQFDDVREMERRSLLCHKDGILEIGIGAGLFILGFGVLFGFGALAIAYMALLRYIVNHAKRSITVPRMHHLDFIPEPETELKLRRRRTVVLVSPVVFPALGLLALLVPRIVSASMSTVLRSNAIVVFGCMLAALFFLVGWGTATKRLYYCAAVAVFASVIGYWFGLSVAVYLIMIGAVTAWSGAVVLSRFVRNYPRLIRYYPRMLNRSGRAYQRTF